MATFQTNAIGTDISSFVLTLTPLDSKGLPETGDPIKSATYALDSAGIVTAAPSADTLSCTFTPVGKTGSTVVTVTAVGKSGNTVTGTGTIMVTSSQILGGVQLNWTVIG